jgi:hypothetical protein
MKLAGDEKRVFGQFNDFNQLAVRCESTQNKPFLLKASFSKRSR